MNITQKNTGDMAETMGVIPNLRVWLGGLVALFVILASAYCAITPAAVAEQHNPDENAHMLYIESLVSGHLPVFHKDDNSYESHQPPLYYLLCAPAYLAVRGFGEATATRAVRFVSILFGILLVICSFECIKVVFPKEPWLALGTAAFIALLPMNAALSGAVTNDSLSNLLIVIALWKLARCIVRVDADHPKVSQKSLIMLGIASGLGILTKTSTLVLFPTVLAAFALMAYKKLISPADAGKSVAISLGLGMLIGAPWLLRNQILYGDPLAQHIFTTSFGNTAQAVDVMRALHSLNAYLGVVAQWTFASFWGVFDHMTLFFGQSPHGRTPFITEPLSAVYDILALICVVSLGGVFAFIKRGQLSTGQSIVLASFLVLILVTGYGFFNFILTFFQAQGRYWFTALLPFAFFFTLGFKGLFPNHWFKFAMLGMGVGLLGLNLYAIFGLLLPRFAGS